MKKKLSFLYNWWGGAPIGRGCCSFYFNFLVKNGCSTRTKSEFDFFSKSLTVEPIDS